MKKVLLLVGLFSAFTTIAQETVKWNYTIKKKSAKEFELHISATIQNGWHLFSQTLPDRAIALPTKIKFNKNPLLTNSGKTKEIGELITKHEPELGTDSKYYEGAVEFVQTIQLKNSVKTNITGSISFMTCKDGQCLPPKTILFSVKIE